jgi:hypothetical protein
VARRRRRRERRDSTEHRPAQPLREKRTEDRRRLDVFEAGQKSLRRRRTFIGALGFIPLVGALGCSAAGIPLLCQVPQEWWLAIWAVLFGSFLGITLRLFLERRKFRRGVASG